VRGCKQGTIEEKKKRTHQQLGRAILGIFRRLLSPDLGEVPYVELSV